VVAVTSGLSLTPLRIIIKVRNLGKRRALDHTWFRACKEEVDILE
jgi:hypothetical protein